MKKKLLKGVLLIAAFAFGTNLNAQCPIIPNDPIANPAVFNFCSGSTTAMISAETTTGGPGSLASPNQAGGNGCGGGVMFDITNTSLYDITINAFDVRLQAANPPITVYTKTGTYLGSETVMANWNLLGNYTTTGAAQAFDNVDVTDFVVPAGTTLGIYLNYNSSYSNITVPQVASNSELTLTLGAGLCSAFGGVNPGRGFNGTVYYTSAVPTGAIWYDAATGGNVLGTSNPFEALGTTVMPTATAGTYDFYVSSGVAGCESVNRTLVTVNLDPVLVDIDSIDVTCNNGNDGSFVVASTSCGSSPFTFSVDGGLFGAIPTNLTPGVYSVIAKDANGAESAAYNVEVGNVAGPSVLDAYNISATSAVLSWTANGSETSWSLEWGAPGFVPGTGTSLGSALANTNPHTITITPNTSYEYYVRAECGGTTPGAWSGPYAFDNMYCAPTYTYTSEYLSLIETVGGILDVSHASASYPAGGYSDQTAQVLQVYETLTFDLNTVYTPTYGHAVRVWVDWNNDFNFDHTTELVSTITGSGGLLTQQITVPAGTPVGTYRVRVRGVYGTGANPMPCSNESWGSAADFTLEVIAPPTCLPPMNIVSSNIATNSIQLSWTELNAATSWNIEYGPSGYTQGSAAGIPVLANSNPFTVTGLNPSANYDFYVQSICSASDQSAWRGPYSQYTACGIAIAPYYEGFNSGVQPQCWDNLSSDPSTSAWNYWDFNKQGEYGALNNGKAIGTFANSDGSTPNPDSMMLITPEIDISQLTTPYLSFEWFSNNTNNPGDNVPLIIEVFDGTTWHLLDTLMGDDPEWQFVNYNLSAFSNNIIQVRFMTNQSVPGTAFYNDILLDEVRIDDCISLGGQDGSFDICRFDNTVNLEDNIIVKPNGGGIWSFPGQPAYLVDDTLFNVQYLPAGSYEVYYVERFVCYDTTVATINVFGPSSAGIDGSINNVCLNEPVNLFGVLSGNIDLGGNWYDFAGVLLPNSQPKAQPIPGQYNYTYVVSNGVCPADTSIVEVGVIGTCNFLGLGDEMLTDVSVYPNPATSILTIDNPSNTSSLKVEMLDMNGRVVLVDNKALNNATEATLTIDHLERGIYTLRVYNNESQKTFKIVKQ